MKIVKFLSIVLIILIMNENKAFAQDKNYLEAVAAFNSFEYAEAIDFFKQAYVKTKDKDIIADIVFKTAECYRNLENSKQSEVWYQKAIMIKYPDPIVILYYADALKMNEKYDEALVEYKKYTKLSPGDSRGKLGVKSCEEASEWRNNPTRYEVENMAFFNSRWDDHCPAYGKKDYLQVYFSSSREGSTGNEIHKGTGQSFSDIYETQSDRKGKWSEPVPLSEPVNTPFDEGTPSLDMPKGSVMYFTRCRYEKDVRLGCQIYTATKAGATWKSAEAVPIAEDTMLVRQPSVSGDLSALYFSADLPGGKGGYDIWMIKREKKGGIWEKPVNLGFPINTSGDEVFPYIRENGTLYFSSNGHTGMGGLDIFKTEKDKKTGKYKVINMRYPINSSADDFGIVFEGNLEKGFLTSNRKGGQGGDDIYSFILPPLEFTLKGIVKDEKTEAVLDSAKVKLIGSDGSTKELYSEADGSYKFTLLAETDYVIETKRDNYLNGKGRETTKGLVKSQDILLDIYMTPIEKPIELPNIEYDLNKWDLRPESMVSLDKLIETLNDNSNIVIELGSHTDFRSSTEYNDTLSQKRAQSVVNYLIEKGIESERLVAKGYGERNPNVVIKKMAERYRFLPEGKLLDEKFIKTLATVEEQEIAHQINRRTEFRVLRSDFITKKKPVKPEKTDTENETESDSVDTEYFEPDEEQPADSADINTDTEVLPADSSNVKTDTEELPSDSTKKETIKDNPKNEEPVEIKKEEE